MEQWIAGLIAEHNLPGPTWVIQLGIMLTVALLAIGLWAAFVAGVLTYVERRVAGKIQNRIGPNRVGPNGLLQFVADGVKLILKEDIIPAEADRPLFRLAPYLVGMGTFLTLVVMPWGQRMVISNLNVGVVYLVAVTSFVVVGILMSGWASNNKWSLLGGFRSAAQVVSYEIPTGLSLLTVVILSGSLSLSEIVGEQGGGFGLLRWNVFHNPFTFVAFFIYFISALAENNRIPFDIPEAESELVSGYNTEYSGIRFGVFFIGEFATIWIVAAVATALFLGGWNFPGITDSPTGFWGAALGTGVFLAKSFALVLLILQIRWTLPRVRVDQLMAICWKYLVPISVFNVVMTAVWLVLFKGRGLYDLVAGLF
ncbi:NADH-quinone oxidoreductase subunit NuoH [bacterium]|nr:NADH-quinone oxidoreductase subunit NuoH [bacterium]